MEGEIPPPPARPGPPPPESSGCYHARPGADSRAAPCGASARAAGGAAVVLERLADRRRIQQLERRLALPSLLVGRSFLVLLGDVAPG